MSYYTHCTSEPQPWLSFGQDCAQQCTMIDSCQGIEFHTSGYCEVWTRSGGIRATAWRQNYQCHRYLEARQTDFPALLNFEPVNGGKDQACRGLSLSDNSPSYFTVETASSIEDCATKCAQHGACQGIEYHPSGRCEIWTRSGWVNEIGCFEGCFWFGCKYSRNRFSTVLQPCHLETCAVLVCIRYPHKSMMFFHLEVAPWPAEVPSCQLAIGVRNTLCNYATGNFCHLIFLQVKRIFRTFIASKRFDSTLVSETANTLIYMWTFIKKPTARTLTVFT